VPTGQSIINNSLTALNILDAGGAPSASESLDLLTELNVMVEGWSTEELLIPSIASAQYPLTAAANPYALGPVPAGFAGAILLGKATTISAISNASPAVMTAAAIVPPLVTGQVVAISGFTVGWATANGVWPIIVLSATTFSIPIDSTGFGAISGVPAFSPTAPRPVRVDQAVLVATVGAGKTRKSLRIVSSKTYFGHADLAAAATSADELYLDWAESATGALSAYLFPVPSCPTATLLELETWNAVAAFALGVNQFLPTGYQDAIQQALSYRCLSRYGAAVNPATAEIVADIGKVAVKRIMQLNAANRLLDPALLEAATAPPAQPGRGQQ